VDPGGSEEEKMADLGNRAHDSEGMLESRTYLARPIHGCEDIIAISVRSDIWPEIGDELRLPIAKFAELQKRALRGKEGVALMKGAHVTGSKAFGPCTHHRQIIALRLHLNVSSS
jgi:hypothetical protein